ncbi:uncharacterized protein LOC101459902 [Ceratitis capitata]|uniref:(Mediterranean fruit fly) hypothetical protein n=1 Tax=Ceratitis capitata TaxID=7213 RepID=W8B4M1_CERCA|nr:uncharacterized protein LOC101459902 [Ceratitis capitata]CAD7014044.1 unnamed protein product [Ceratitis capitata]
MSTTSSPPRCNCCDEVMEELLSMRLSFEKLFYRIRKEIVGLRREVVDVLVGSTETKDSHTTSVSFEVLDVNKSRSHNDKSEPAIRIDNNESDNVESVKTKKAKSSDAPQAKDNFIKEKERVEPGLIVATPRPVLDFFNLQARVMPTQPFREAQQFEDWNILLRNDEDQRDQLRVELMQSNFKEPEKYIIQTWRNIFHNDAAQHYSFRGTGRNKRAIKDYIFTDIFKEVFLQRFQHMDTEFFIERTMRFFKYVRDQRRKAALKQRKLQEKEAATPTAVVQDSMDDE